MEVVKTIHTALHKSRKQIRMDILENTVSILLRRAITFGHEDCAFVSAKKSDFSNKNSINITFVTLLILFGVGIGACFRNAAGAFSLQKMVYPDLNMA